jgi:hypothetical protein
MGTSHCSRRPRRSQPMDSQIDYFRTPLWNRSQGANVRVHNLAFPGATVEDDLEGELSRFFSILRTDDGKTVLEPSKTTYGPPASAAWARECADHSPSHSFLLGHQRLRRCRL